MTDKRAVIIFLCKHLAPRKWHHLPYRLLFCLGSGWTLLLAGCDLTNSATWQLQVMDPRNHSETVIMANHLEDRLLLINYWAEWCKPCIEEIPELNHFHRQYSEQVVVLGYNFDQKQGESLQQALAAIQMQYPALLNPPDGVFQLPPVNGLPTTFVINAEGQLLNTLLGPQTLDALQQLLIHTGSNDNAAEVKSQ